MEPLTLFAIVTAVVLSAVIVIDWKGQPFQLDKEYLSLKVLGVIPAVVCLFCRDRLLKYLGFFIASWLAVFSFFGGALDMSLLAVPGVLVVVWLALLGWRYKK